MLQLVRPAANHRDDAAILDGEEIFELAENLGSNACFKAHSARAVFAKFLMTFRSNSTRISTSTIAVQLRIVWPTLYEKKTDLLRWWRIL